MCVCVCMYRIGRVGGMTNFSVEEAKILLEPERGRRERKGRGGGGSQRDYSNWN